MGFIMLLFIICVVGIIYIKIKQNDTSVKTDAVEFDTRKSVSEITDVLRSLNCQIERLNDDPLDNSPSSAIAVLCYGEPNFTDKFKHPGGNVSVWGVQVMVADLGDRRHVRLVALGQSIMGNTSYNKGYGMGFSREYRDRIASMLA